MDKSFCIAVDALSGAVSRRAHTARRPFGLDCKHPLRPTGFCREAVPKLSTLIYCADSAIHLCLEPLVGL